MIVQLIRHAYLPDCTLGTLTAGDIKLQTIERPWLPGPGIGGLPTHSCVPDGTYSLFRHSSVKFPDTFALSNPGVGVWYQPGDVPRGTIGARTAILIHKGNTVVDVIGCIAIGTRYSLIDNQHTVLDSGRALDQLRSVLGTDYHVLIIRPTAGTMEIGK